MFGLWLETPQTYINIVW